MVTVMLTHVYIAKTKTNTTAVYYYYYLPLLWNFASEGYAQMYN